MHMQLCEATVPTVFHLYLMKYFLKIYDVLDTELSFCNWSSLEDEEGASLFQQGTETSEFFIFYFDI